MKQLKTFEKIIYWLNVLVAFLLLLSYMLYYVPPKQFAFISVLSLGVPLLILLNGFFLIFWLFKLKRQLFLSLLVLLIGYRYVSATYKFSKPDLVTTKNDFSIMNYNVRLFNVFNWIPSKTVKKDILNFIATEKPDILCLQEYHENESEIWRNYQSHKVMSNGNIKSGQVIFSKFPIINKGVIPFKNSSNKTIFVDILKEKDTLRIYNVHLQSTGINTDINQIDKHKTEYVIKRVGHTFKKQQDQSELVLQHIKQCPYKVIVCGDFNNTAFSYVYNKLKGNLNDTFEEAGSGFGKTFDFKFFPVRIDFILTDEQIKVLDFKTYKIKHSDHFPVKATIAL